MSMRSENGAFRKSYKEVVSDSSMEAHNSSLLCKFVRQCVYLGCWVAGLPGAGCRVAKYKIWPGLILPRQA
jgi:hypothetical protein